MLCDLFAYPFHRHLYYSILSYGLVYHVYLWWKLWKPIQISLNCDSQDPIIDFDELTSMGQICDHVPDSKVHGANVGPTWGRQDPGGPHVGHTNLAIWGGRYPREMLF